MPLRPDEIDEVEAITRKIIKEELAALTPAPKPAAVKESPKPVAEAAVAPSAKKKEK